MANSTPKALERGQPEKVLAYLRTDRDRTVFILMWRGGLRCQEACLVRVGDVTVRDGGSVNVHVEYGKGGSKRDVIIGAKYAQPIIRQIGGRRAGWLLPTKSGANIQTSHVRRILRRFKTNPHALRHCFARDLLDEDFSVRDIQYCLGHERLNTTEIYLGKLTLEDRARKKMESRA